MALSYMTPITSPSDTSQKPKKLEDIPAASVFIPSPFSPPSTPGVYGAPIPIFDITFTKPFYPASDMGTFGSRTFYSRHSGTSSHLDKSDSLQYRDALECKFTKSNLNNPPEYDRDFYDRFGHNNGTIDCIREDINIVIPEIKKPEPVRIETRAKVGVTTETTANIAKPDIKTNKKDSKINESNIDYEKILNLPPLPVHLRYINTTSPNFNFNDPSFDLLEFAEIRRRERLIEKLKAEMENSS